MNNTMSSSVNVIMTGQTFGSLSSKNSERPLVGTITGTGTSGSTVGGGGLGTTNASILTSRQHLPKTTFEKNLEQGDAKITPRRGISKTNLKVPGRLIPRSLLERPCQHHSFLTDITDVRQMEKGLLQLLDDFHSGKLQAFGKDCSFEKMDSVREQQEKLARLHFDLCVQQDGYNNPLSEEGRTIAKENMAKLMENLQQLSLSIEQLHSSTSNSGLQTEV